VASNKGGASSEQDVMQRTLFVIKIEAVQVVLVAAMRCPSAAAASTLVPAMQVLLEEGEEEEEVVVEEI
jgi:hypothetical protein